MELPYMERQRLHLMVGDALNCSNGFSQPLHTTTDPILGLGTAVTATYCIKGVLNPNTRQLHWFSYSRPFPFLTWLLQARCRSTLTYRRVRLAGYFIKELQMRWLTWREADPRAFKAVGIMGNAGSQDGLQLL